MKPRRHTKMPQPMDAERSAAERKPLWWMLGLGFIGALVLACALVFGLGGTRPLTAEGRGVLAAYEKVRSALADDDLEAAKRDAAELAQRFADRTPASRPAQRIATAPTLEAARIAFVELSHDAMRLARGQDGYLLARCPIKNCPEPCKDCPMSRYGPWVQVSSEVANPYMGRAHLRCGVIQP